MRTTQAQRDAHIEKVQAKSHELSLKYKSARGQIKALTEQLAAARSNHDNYRARASRAEAEAAEWRKRFDLLLSRVPHTPAPFLPIPGAPDTCMFCGRKHDGLACPQMSPRSEISTQGGAHSAEAPQK